MKKSAFPEDGTGGTGDFEAVDENVVSAREHGIDAHGPEGADHGHGVIGKGFVVHMASRHGDGVVEIPHIVIDGPASR